MESPVYIETFDVHFEHCTFPFAQLAETISFTVSLYSFPEYSSFPEDGTRTHEMKERDDSHSHPERSDCEHDGASCMSTSPKTVGVAPANRTMLAAYRLLDYIFFSISFIHNRCPRFPSQETNKLAAVFSLDSRS
jgi:hypothetical protein